MLAKWSRIPRHLRRIGAESHLKISADLHVFHHRSYAKVAAAVAPNIGQLGKGLSSGHVVCISFTNFKFRQRVLVLVFFLDSNCVSLLIYALDDDLIIILAI